MTDRVVQFREIQEGLNEICYTDNFLHVISNIFDNSGKVTENGENAVKQEIIHEINEMWLETSNTQNKTMTSLEFDNVQGLYAIISTMQVYASLGFIVYSHDESLTSDNVITSLDNFRVKSCELFSRKNADYGDAFANYGVVGVMVRMGDKIARINSLSKNKEQVSDESIVDTFIDLYNYCIMTLMLICDSVEKKEKNTDPYHIKDKLLSKISLLEQDLSVTKAEYSEVMKRIQSNCDHSWVRNYSEYCDSHTPHYCEKCDLMD